MDKEWAEQFFADPEGLGSYRSATENNCETDHVSLGHIHVYREFKPAKDSLEYTVYFKHEGSNHRLDFEVSILDIEGKSTDWVNGYIEGFAVAEVPQQLEWEKEMREGLITPQEVRDKRD